MSSALWKPVSMKQLAWPSKPASSGSPARKRRDVLDERLALEVGDRTGLRGGHVGGVADDEDVRRGLRLQRVLVGRHEVELVAETRRAADVRGAAVQRDDDGEIERDLAAVVADEPAAGAVDLAGVELGDELDALARRASRRAARTAIGLVNAPSSGVDVGDLRPGRGCRARWKYQSARKQNSSGATGHLIGMSTTLTTSRPPSKVASAAPSAAAPSGV